MTGPLSEDTVRRVREAAASCAAALAALEAECGSISHNYSVHSSNATETGKATKHMEEAKRAASWAASSVLAHQRGTR